MWLSYVISRIDKAGVSQN